MDVRFLLGKQTAKGTPQTTDVSLLAATSSSVTPNVNKVSSKAIGTGRWEKDGFVSKVEVNGDVAVELSTGQMEMFLLGAGFKSKTVATKNLEFTPDDAYNNYLTLITDNVESDIHEYAQDCLISSLKINAQLEAYITGTATLIGMNHTIQNAKFAGTPTAFKGKPLICLGSVIKEKNTDITAEIESIDITIDNKLEGKGALNSIYNKAIRQSDRGSVSLSLQFNEFNKTSYKNAHDMLKANTSYAVEVTFAEVEDKTKKVVLTFPNCKIGNVEATDLEGAGGISKELNAYFDDGIKSPVKIVLENYLP
jgi:hypothetical protein|nr:MAG TPA: Tail tube protein [Caudoviricetes sp.]